MEWTNEITLEFLNLYQQEAVIWNPKDPQHKNRNAVNDAWKRIETSLSIECCVKDLKKKKESLMAIFRPLLNKVKASRHSGTGEVYKPNWFAFKPMAKFLYAIYQPRITITAQEFVDVGRVDDSELDKEQATQYITTKDNVDNSDSEIPSKTQTPENSCASPPYKKSKKRKESSMAKVEKGMEEPYKIMKHVCETQEKDECSLYADLLATRLRAFDNNTRDIIMYEIDSLIFRTKMQKHNNNQHNQPLPSTSSLNQPYCHEHYYYSQPCPHSQHSPRYPNRSPESSSNSQTSPAYSHPSPKPSPNS